MLSNTFLDKPIKKNPQKLSLVALMDIFTILVFFLLLNTGDTQRIGDAKFVTLPDAVKGSVPYEEFSIKIGQDKIWVDDEEIVEVADVLAEKDQLISPLSQALEAYYKSYVEKKGELTAFEKKEGLSVTIMADKEIPFSLLKKVMWTCRKQHFRNISIALNKLYDPGLQVGS